FLTLTRPSLVLFLVRWLKLVKDFLKVRCRLALLPFLISCLIWLDLVASLPLIKERILVIILLLHFLSLMLGSVLVLMLPSIKLRKCSSKIITSSLHFHAVHFMRTLPTGSVDPNFGRRVRNRRQLNSLQNTWPYGYSMPIAVRYTQDAFSRSGWLWPVDAKGEPLK